MLQTLKNKVTPRSREELIESEENEIIEELREVLDEMRTRDQQAKAKGLEDATELSFYHALEEVLLTEDHDTAQQELVELTGDIIAEVENVADVVEWQEKVTVQQKLRKRVKLRLMKTDIQMSGEERTELTNRIVELARAHYQP